MNLTEKQLALIIHLGQLCNFVIPTSGILIPIVVWQMYKDQFPSLDQHGKIVVNWILSAVIYGFIFSLLTFFLIGIPLLLLLGALAIVYPIYGAIQASNGKVWAYPLSFKLI